MRSLILPAALMILVIMGTLSSAAGQKQYPHAEYLAGAKLQHQKLHLAQHLSKLHRAVGEGVAQATRKNGMQLQQGTELLSPVSDEPQCTTSEFTTTMFSVFAQCAAVVTATWPLQLNFATDAEAQTAWDSFCATTCYSELKAKLDGTNLEVCVHPDIKFFLRSSVFMCETKSSSGESCGVSYSRLNRYSQCEGNLAEADCTASSDVCESYTLPSSITEGLDTTDSNIGKLTNTTNYLGGTTGCRGVFSTSVISKVCDGGCLAGYLAEVKASTPDSVVVTGLSLLDQLICRKADDGDYCGPKVGTFMQTFEDGQATASTFSTMCSDSAALTCFRQITGISAGAGVNALKEFLQSCAIQFQNVTASVSQYCVPQFESSMASVKQLRQFASHMCVTNAAGDYCMQKRSELYAEACYSISRADATKTTCEQSNSDCKDKLQTLVDGMGCCAGIVQEVFTKTYRLSPDEYPVGIEGVAVPTEAVAQLGTTEPLTFASNEEETTSAGPGFLADLAFCGVTGLNQTLRKRCALGTVKVAKTLGVRLSWAALLADAVLKAQIQASLKADVAANLGLTEDEIVDDQLVRDASIIIQLAATAAGARRRQTTSEAGTSYEFSIQAVDESTTENAGSSFDSLQSSGNFQMSQTAATATSECGSSCLDASAGANGLVASETTTDSSGAALLSAVAVMAAVLAALF